MSDNKGFPVAPTWQQRAEAAEAKLAQLQSEEMVEVVARAIFDASDLSIKWDHTGGGGQIHRDRATRQAEASLAAVANHLGIEDE